jgi:hypothetical protein
MLAAALRAPHPVTSAVQGRGRSRTMTLHAGVSNSMPIGTITHPYLEGTTA